MNIHEARELLHEGVHARNKTDDPFDFADAIQSVDGVLDMLGIDPEELTNEAHDLAIETIQAEVKMMIIVGRRTMSEIIAATAGSSFMIGVATGALWQRNQEEKI